MEIFSCGANLCIFTSTLYNANQKNAKLEISELLSLKMALYQKTVTSNLSSASSAAKQIINTCYKQQTGNWLCFLLLGQW